MKIWQYLLSDLTTIITKNWLSISKSNGINSMKDSGFRMIFMISASFCSRPTRVNNPRPSKSWLESSPMFSSTCLQASLKLRSSTCFEILSMLFFIACKLSVSCMISKTFLDSLGLISVKSDSLYPPSDHIPWSRPWKTNTCSQGLSSDLTSGQKRLTYSNKECILKLNSKCIAEAYRICIAL
mgnify:CR=1 FL=1